MDDETFETGEITERLICHDNRLKHFPFSFGMTTLCIKLCSVLSQFTEETVKNHLNGRRKKEGRSHKKESCRHVNGLPVCTEILFIRTFRFFFFFLAVPTQTLRKGEESEANLALFYVLPRNLFFLPSMWVKGRSNCYQTQGWNIKTRLDMLRAVEWERRSWRKVWKDCQSLKDFDFILRVSSEHNCESLKSQEKRWDVR